MPTNNDDDVQTPSANSGKEDMAEVVRMTRDAGRLGAFVIEVRWPDFDGTTEHNFPHSLPLDEPQYAFDDDPTVPTSLDTKRGSGKVHRRVIGPIPAAIRESTEVLHWRYWYERLRENLKIAREQRGLGYEVVVSAAKKNAIRDGNYLWGDFSARDLWLFESGRETVNVPGYTSPTSNERDERLLRWARPLGEALNVPPETLFMSREELKDCLRTRR